MIRLIPPIRFVRRVLAAAMVAAAAGTSIAAYAQTLPQDALQTCVAPPTKFAQWFVSGHPSLNGPVNPANSILFSTNPNCDFYLWSHQMFMWITSPAPASYGGKGRVFNSPVFYDVSNADSNGDRHFIPHLQRPLPFPIGTGKVGMEGLPVVIDKAGRPHEVIEAPRAANGNSTALVSGKPIEIRSITGAAGTRAVLRDAKGQAINAAVTITPEIVPRGLLARRSRALLNGGAKLTTDAARMNFVLAKLRKANVLERFVVSGKTVFVNLNTGIVTDVDPAQAGFGVDVLLANDGSVIFYQTVVNDVYAYFLTGVAHNALPPSNNQFPITGSMAAAIVQYAATNGVQNKTIVDPEALAIEIKMAWIEVTPALANPQSYITIQASIPVYDTSNAALWKPVNNKVTTMALVGIHVVGSTVHHPEMLWATFEHFGNTPLATYQYNNAAGTQTVTQSTAGPWVFSASGSTGPFNVPHADYKSKPNIEGTGGFNVTASDTLRQAPFGTPYNQTPPNPIDATPAAANTELIALNNNILKQMAAAGASADVRNNYFQTGTTWTAGGASPNGHYPAGNEVGTNYLTNSTMETYQQSPNNNMGGTNCFSCHQTNTTAVSHVYPVLKPLF